jgi:hypothetical protein
MSPEFLMTLEQTTRYPPTAKSVGSVSLMAIDFAYLHNIHRHTVRSLILEKEKELSLTGLEM